jgi:hypothetical protein
VPGIAPGSSRRKRGHAPASPIPESFRGERCFRCGRVEKPEARFALIACDRCLGEITDPIELDAAIGLRLQHWDAVARFRSGPLLTQSDVELVAASVSSMGSVAPSSIDEMLRVPSLARASAPGSVEALRLLAAAIESLGFSPHALMLRAFLSQRRIVQDRQRAPWRNAADAVDAIVVLLGESPTADLIAAPGFQEVIRDLRMTLQRADAAARQKMPRRNLPFDALREIPLVAMSALFARKGVPECLDMLKRIARALNPPSKARLKRAAAQMRDAHALRAYRWALDVLTAAAKAKNTSDALRAREVPESLWPRLEAYLRIRARWSREQPGRPSPRDLAALWLRDAEDGWDVVTSPQLDEKGADAARDDAVRRVATLDSVRTRSRR